MQEALVAAHEHHGRATDLRGAALNSRAAGTCCLLRHVVPIAVGARLCAAEGRRQIAVSAVNGRADVGRLRIDNVTNDGILQLDPELLARFGTVSTQIQHQRTAVLIFLAGPLDQLAPGLFGHGPLRRVFGTLPVKG